MATANEAHTTTPSKPTRSVGLALSAFGLGLTTLLCMLATRGRYDQFLTEYGLELPLITRVALSWVLPVVLAIVLVFAAVMELVRAKRVLANGCNLAALLVGVGVLFVYLAGALISLSNLMDGLSSS